MRDLIEKEARLWDITSAIPGCIYQFALHRDGSISMSYMSEGFRILTGISPSILIEDATRMYDYIHPEDCASFSESITVSAETMAPWRTEFRIFTLEQETIWLSGISNPRLLPDGSILWNGVLTDITKRKQAEEELRQSEKRFRTAISEAPLPIMIHAEDGQVMNISKVWTSITGYTHSDIPTIDAWTSRAYGQKMENVKAIIDAVFERGAIARDGVFEIRTDSGAIRIWDFLSGPLGELSDGRRLLISMATDITEMQRLQRLESRAERLETAGTIAGQVAHDFNNLLAPLMAYPDIIREELPAYHPALKYLDQIEIAA